MVLVKMDVDELRGAVSDLKSFWDKAMAEWTEVSNASYPALADTGVMSTALSTHLVAVSDRWQDLQARIDLAVLVNTGDDGNVPSGVLEYTLPGSTESLDSVKQALGEELAEYSATEHARSDTDGQKTLDGLLARYVDDQLVMGSFFDEVGPEGLFDLMSETAGHMGVDETELRLSILDHLKEGLHTADEGWTPTKSRTYAESLVDAAAHPGDEFREYWSDYSSALSFLLYDSDYSDEFLTSAADAIDAYERVEADGQAGLWSSRMMGPNKWGAYFPEDAISATWDPSVSLMTALANNAEVSLDFFSEGGGNGEPNDRQMYWIHDRKWSDDQFSALSGALDAATTDPSILSDPTQAGQAATLASHTVNLLGHRPGIDGDTLTGDMGGTDASEHLAHILATYMYGADVAAANRAPVDWNEGGSSMLDVSFADGQSLTPFFNKDSLTTFIALASGTPDGMTTLRGGLDAYADRKYSLALASLDEGTEAGEDNWTNAYTDQGGLEGLFVKAVGDSAIAKAKGDDETRQLWISLASDGVGMIPFGSLVTKAGGGAVVEQTISFALDKGISEATDSATEKWASLEDAAMGEWNGKADESLQRSRYAALQAIAAHGGHLTPDGSPIWNPDGTLISWSELQELSPQDRLKGLTTLNDSDSGAGVILDQRGFDEAYQSAFDAYFQ
ncbi:DUF6571 family protein [uncultured Cellulomonas sp.]|uniref:DUF6571 family protein n=1 Tax=uncultured Cellulomonas sp. TaxID=189682 RepID=UPI0028E78661|nr:DUF6571 family protein [uncultured Cellulomonas sp.]